MALAFCWLVVGLALFLQGFVHYSLPTWVQALPWSLPVGYLAVLHAYALPRRQERTLIGFWVTAASALVAALALVFYYASLTN